MFNFRFRFLISAGIVPALFYFRVPSLSAVVIDPLSESMEQVTSCQDIWLLSLVEQLLNSVIQQYHCIRK